MKAALIAAPHSGAGKTTVTLGILRALTRRGVAVRSGKIGPDYIDPRFHEAASGRPCPNLDPWAMSQDRLASLIAGDGPLLIEGAMGLFDGAGATSQGSASHLARLFDLPVVLVVDCASAGASIAAVVLGMMTYGTELHISGLILNQVGSARHEALLRDVLGRPANGTTLPPVIGVLHRNPAFARPARHLGLVQASEHADLNDWLDQVADAIEAGVTLDALFADTPVPATAAHRGMPPPGQRIAVARDTAFAFSYPHILDDWRRAGAEIRPFSPLNDDPVPQADFVYLPGGYPELHAGRIAANKVFIQSLRYAAHHADIYGECGGYMVLGDGMTDADGTRHEMAGLLRLETSFARRKLSLGYRVLRADTGPFVGTFSGHEFHYSTEVSAHGTPLFAASNAEGVDLPPMGLRNGRVCGSYAHVIDRGAHL